MDPLSLSDQNQGFWANTSQVEDGPTVEEEKWMIKNYEEAMAPSQEEEDWMMLEEIKKELHLKKYRIFVVPEDVCDVCERKFFKKGSLGVHMMKEHCISFCEMLVEPNQTTKQEVWLTKSLPNLDEFVTIIPLKHENKSQPRKWGTCEDVFKEYKPMKYHIEINRKDKPESQIQAAVQNSKEIINDIIFEIMKRDKKSNKPGSNYQEIKRDIKSNKPGSNYQDIKRDIKSNKTGYNYQEIIYSNIRGGGCNEIEQGVRSDTEDDDDDLTGEESDPEVNPQYEYNYSEKDERYVGNKPTFVQAVEELKRAFEVKDKNVMLINNFEIVVKENRNVKYGVEIDVEIKKKKLKGYAVLKIWGPSDSAKAKKKCTIMVSKSRLSDESFATTLSRKVIKHLIYNHMRGEDFKSLITNIFKQPDKLEKVQCKKCRKEFTKNYLKIHIDKIHPECNICCESFITKSDLLDHNLKTHSVASIQIVKEVLENEKKLKRASFKFQRGVLICDICNYIAKTNRLLWLHKERKHISDPTDQEMVGTKRDCSLMRTNTSEPPNKKKQKNQEEEVMEVVDKEVVSNPKEEAQKMSDMMDDKILRKRRSQEEKETKEHMEREEMALIEKGKKKPIDNKKKDIKKKEQLKSKEWSVIENKIEKKKKLDKKLMHPKLKKLPKAVDCLNLNSLEFIAEGDGACCMNCLAMWIFLDETVMGPQSGRDLNTFIASYREHYENAISFPMTVTIGIGGKTIEFEEGEEDSFFDTLVSSQEMSFMWRNGLDVQALSDMSKMPIECYIYNSETESVEETQYFKPHVNFPWKENDPIKPLEHNFKREKMKLINYKNVHFNLIVDENDAVVTSLVPDTKPTEVVSQIKNKDEEKHQIKELTKKLKYSEESKDKVVKDHKESMKVIGQMKETIEKLQIELKTLSTVKKYLQSNEQISSFPAPMPSNQDIPSFRQQEEEDVQTSQQQHEQQEQMQQQPLLKQQEKQSAAQQQQSRPSPQYGPVWPQTFVTMAEREGAGSERNQRNCTKCYFQSNSEEEMTNHFKMSHIKKRHNTKVEIRTEKIACRNCEVTFENYYILMNHRRDNHPTNRPCRYDLENRCKHSADVCWYRHKNSTNQSQTQANKCYDCNEEFRERNDLMMHKKNQHPDKCTDCEKYQKNQCAHEELCWFLHRINQDFHKVHKNLKPPINAQK